MRWNEQNHPRIIPKAFPMICKQCGKNKWGVRYDGDSDTKNKICTKPENLDNIEGVFGKLTLKCIQCRHEKEIKLGC